MQKKIQNNDGIKVYTLMSEQVEAPKFNEDKRKDWVAAGDNNMFFEEILKLSNEAAMHSSIVNKKTRMILGKSIEINSKEPIQQQVNFLKSVNRNGETIEQIMEKCAYDLTVSGMFFLQIGWGSGKDKKKIAEITHVPFQKQRSGKNNEEGKVDTFFLSDKWAKYTKDDDITPIPAFSQTDNLTVPQLLASIQYRAGCTYYSLPSWIGGFQAIDNLAQISNFHNNAIRNGFTTGSLLIFRGPIPTPESRQEIVSKLTQKFAGTYNANSQAVLFMDGEQLEPKFEHLSQNDLDKRFDQLEKSVKENVILAHSIPRSVAGIESVSSMGNSSRNVIENELYFYNSFIKYEQEFLLNTFNKIMIINGWDKIIIKNPSASLMLYSEALISQVLSKGEIRELFGYSREEQLPEQLPEQPTTTSGSTIQN